MRKRSSFVGVRDDCSCGLAPPDAQQAKKKPAEPEDPNANGRRVRDRCVAADHAVRGDVLHALSERGGVPAAEAAKGEKVQKIIGFCAAAILVIWRKPAPMRLAWRDYCTVQFSAITRHQGRRFALLGNPMRKTALLLSFVIAAAAPSLAVAKTMHHHHRHRGRRGAGTRADGRTVERRQLADVARPVHGARLHGDRHRARLQPPVQRAIAG